MTRIFISHSHSDKIIAYKLVNFLLAALKLDEEEILCTSNPDQGLSFTSSSITDQLKNELKTSEALIVLITADSLHSAWIPFEAGSFWTTDKPIIPILGPSLTQNNLPGPLRNFLSISIEAQDLEDQMNKAITTLENSLNVKQKVTQRRNDTLEEFTEKLRAWKSKLPDPDISIQKQVEELKFQLQESEVSHKKQLQEAETTSQQEKQQLEQIYQTQKQELQSQIQQLEQQLEQERSQASKQQAHLQSSIKAAQEELAKKESENAQLLERISRLNEQLQSSSKVAVTVEIELKSEKGINYTKLRDLLAAGKWQEADKETGKVMCQAAGRTSEGWLEEEDIDSFPCEDLRTINQLWLHYSQGKFGFSVQKEIYESLGGTREYNEKVWEKFGDLVGWRKGEKWLNYSDLTFNLELASSAHLPWVDDEIVVLVRIKRCGEERKRVKMLRKSILFSRKDL
jgi:glucan-binding YG repeat protein